MSSQKLQILIARNDSTPDDSNQANALKQVFVKHFINTPTKEQTEEQFSNDCLTAVLGWSSDRITARLIALNYAGAIKSSAKSMARSEKLLSLEKILFALSQFAEGGTACSEVEKLEKRYSVPIKGSRLRGDMHILSRSKKINMTVLDVVYSWLRFIKDNVGQFHKQRRRGELDGSCG